MRRTLLFVVLFTILIESIATWVSPFVAIGMHAVALIILTILWITERAPFDPWQYVAIALLPTSRILVYMWTYAELTPLYRLLLVGIPLWLAFIVLRILVTTPWEKLGFSLEIPIPWTVTAAQLAFVPLLSVVLYYLKPVDPLWRQYSTVGSSTVLGVVLIVFAAIPEAIIHRGLLRATFQEHFSPAVGILLSGLIYEAIMGGSGSITYVILSFGVGTWLSWTTYRYKSIYPSLIMHSWLLMMLYVIMPRFR